MNNTRRKALEDIREKLVDINGDLESLRDEEQEYYDNMPENLQSGEKGQLAEQAADALDIAVSSLEDVLNSVDEACQ